MRLPMDQRQHRQRPMSSRGSHKRPSGGGKYHDREGVRYSRFRHRKFSSSTPNNNPDQPNSILHLFFNLWTFLNSLFAPNTSHPRWTHKFQNSLPSSFDSTTCDVGQVAVGIQTDAYNGPYASIWSATCTQLDFAGNHDNPNICGNRYAFGSSVSCDDEGNVTSIRTASGEDGGPPMKTYGLCTPAKQASNCNDPWGLKLNTTVMFCCSALEEEEGTWQWP